MGRRAIFCVLLAALLLAGCGQSNPALIPQSDADDLANTVDAVPGAVRSGDCEAARETVQQARGQVNDLPARVSDRLKRNLRQWLNHLDQEVVDTCEPATEETPTTGPEGGTGSDNGNGNGGGNGSSGQEPSGDSGVGGQNEQGSQTP